MNENLVKFGSRLPSKAVHRGVRVVHIDVLPQPNPNELCSLTGYRRRYDLSSESYPPLFQSSPAFELLTAA